MSPKSVVMIFFIIGSFIGSYFPVIFGIGVFSYASIISSAVGGLIGIYIGYKLISN